MVNQNSPYIPGHVGLIYQYHLLVNIHLNVYNITYLHSCSTRTLIIGLSQRPTDNQITVEAQVTGSVSSGLLLSNYVGQLARARLAKQTLDDQVYSESCTIAVCYSYTHTQWGRGTVFQEDYFDLLNAAEIGMLITYNPSNAEALLKNFTTLYSNAITEVAKCIIRILINV